MARTRIYTARQNSPSLDNIHRTRGTVVAVVVRPLWNHPNDFPSLEESGRTSVDRPIIDLPDIFLAELIPGFNKTNNRWVVRVQTRLDSPSFSPGISIATGGEGGEGEGDNEAKWNDPSSPSRLFVGLGFGIRFCFLGEVGLPDGIHHPSNPSIRFLFR